MRPLPIILLLVAAVLALVVSLLFLGRDEHSGRSSVRSAPDVDSPPGAPTPGGSALDATGAQSSESSRIQPAASTIPHEPSRVERAAKKEAPTVALGGRVLGNLGKPIEGARVYAAESNEFFGAPLDEIDPERMTWIHRAESATDHEGRFQIRPEARTKVSLSIRAPGFAPLDREFTLSSSERDLGDLVLDASVILAGRVVDSNGRPVEGAKIARLSGSEPAVPIFGGSRGATVGRTDAQGVFRVDELSAGPWHLLVTHEDHPDHLESGESDRAGAVQSDLVFTLEEGAEIQGRVVGAPPEIVPKLSVRAVARGVSEEATPPESPSSFASSVRTARCAPDGSFTLKGLKRSQRYRLTAQESSREFFRGARSVPVTAQAGDRGVELAFKPETAIVFQVVDATSGAPVVDLSVQAGWSFSMPLLDDQGRPVRRFPEGRVRYGALPAPPRSGATGIVPAGSLQNPSSGAGLKLRVESAGYQVFERSDIEVLEGRDTDLGTIRLEPAPTVAVLVLDEATGAPIADAAVSLVEENATPDRHQTRVSFTGDENDPDDAAAFGAGAAQRARTRADGRASVTSLPGKTARLHVRHAGYAKYQSEPTPLPLKESVERTVRLSTGGSVTVEVVDSRGTAVSGAEVDHQAPNSEAGELLPFSADGRTDADGRIVFDHLASGVHRFRLRQGSGGGSVNLEGGGRAVVRRVSRVGGGEDEPGWSAVDVDEHTAASVRLVAPERGTLAGRVSEAGKPLSNASLRLTLSTEADTPMMFRSGGRSTRTDGRGEYLFDGVDEGEYTLSLEHATRAMTFESPARVRAGENHLDLDLPIAIVEGTVTGEDQKPVAGVRVHAERDLGTGGRRRPMSIMVMATSDGSDEPEVNVTSSAGAGPTVVTDASGHYSLRGVLPDVDLVVEANGKDAQPARSGTFTVKPDQLKKDVDLRLERGGAIQISVQRTGGQPAGGFLARATLIGGDPMPKVQMVGPSGSAKLTGLKPGKWRVKLDPLQGALSGGDDAEIPEREVEVQVGETAKASFEVP